MRLRHRRWYVDAGEEDGKFGETNKDSMEAADRDKDAWRCK